MVVMALHCVIARREEDAGRRRGKGKRMGEREKGIRRGEWSRFSPLRLSISSRIFEHANFSARGPRPRFRASLMLSGRGIQKMRKNSGAS